MESGLVYLRARYYSPMAGRFLTEDPYFRTNFSPVSDISVIMQNNNLYAYCGSNPVKRWDPTGKEWTTKDSEVHQRLIENNMPGVANILRYEVNIATDQFTASGATLYDKNNASYRAVEARNIAYGAVGESYKDNFDYTHGQGVLTFLGTHPVPAINGIPILHSSIIIMASPSSEFYNDWRFDNTAYGGGVKYATIGAGELGGKLIGDINRKPNDINLSIKTQMINLNVSAVATIDNLFNLISNFGENQADPTKTIPYTIIPKNSDQHNSNSFTHGILNAAGITDYPTPSGNLPGWKEAVPTYMYSYKFSRHW